MGNAETQKELAKELFVNATYNLRKIILRKQSTTMVITVTQLTLLSTKSYVQTFVKKLRSQSEILNFIRSQIFSTENILQELNLSMVDEVINQKVTKVSFSTNGIFSAKEVG